MTRLIDARDLIGCAIIRPHNQRDFELIKQCSEQVNHADIPTAYAADERSCSNCQFDRIGCDEFPCNECSRAFTDRFKPKRNIDVIQEMNARKLSRFLASKDSDFADDKECYEYLMADFEGDQNGE